MRSTRIPLLRTIMVLTGLAFAAAMTVAGPVVAKPFAPRTVARLDRAVTSSMGANWAPGAIVGVWSGDRAWTATRGVTRRGGGTRPTLAFHTRIGSVTKTFTGTLILQLADEGKLNLDDTIDRWFPTFPNAHAITVRELGTMASGIASYTLDPAIAGRYLASPTAAWTSTQLIDAAATLPPVFAPGDGFQYSNSNFVMLGEIVERVTGQSFATALRERILRPLGLAHTSYPSGTAVPARTLDGYTTQGSADGDVLDATRWNPSFAGAAGQMISTLGDLHVWTRSLGRGTLLKPATQRLRLRPNPHSEGGGRSYDFAIGTDHGWLAHDGALPGYNSQIAYFPKRDVTVVVLTNADLAGADGTAAPAIFRALAKVLTPGNLPRG